MTTITTHGHVIKAKKAPKVKAPKVKAPKVKAPSIGKTRVKGEIRHFPAYREGMSTMAYIEAYHAANSSVMLTMPDYACN